MLRGGRGRQETKVFSDILGKHGGEGGRWDNEGVTVLHREHEVKKVCFGRKVLGRFDPKPQSRA